MSARDPASVDMITLANFEACSIPLANWNHRAHLTVAYLLLRSYPLEEATRRMRAGVQKFNAAHGIAQTPIGGYHETLTVAWMRIVHTTMQVYGPDPASAPAGPADGAGREGDAEPEHSAVAFLDYHTQLQSRVLLRLFYSRDRIMSHEARTGWVEPDLAPLPTLDGGTSGCVRL